MADRDTVIENIKLSKKRWNDNHKEYYKVYSREYYQKNKERIIENRREYKKKYYQKNKERIIENAKKNYKKNGDRTKKKQREKLLQLLGNKCCKCGFSDVRALQFDHIDDDGYLDKKRFNQQTYSVIRYYFKNPEIAKKKLQILCANCNWIKRFEFNKYSQYSKFFVS